VGESGSGKTTTALAVMGLLPTGAARVQGGSIDLEGRDLLRLPERELRRIRGDRVAMVFQDPLTGLNPTMTIGNHLLEAITEHHSQPRRVAWHRAIALLGEVGIGDPELRMRAYPHEISGGMRQRAMIAMSLAADPRVLIADEPTSALDVTIQAQILALLARIQRERALSVLLITHDLGIVSSVADDVLVMYAGCPMEMGSVDDIFYRPQHPYTRGLLRSVATTGLAHRQRLQTIRGLPPTLGGSEAGCSFRDRCPLAVEVCTSVRPTWRAIDGDHFVACHVTPSTSDSPNQAAEIIARG
jgi:oligopeptide/dipeptide ABC transporter ATP-binding protein